MVAAAPRRFIAVSSDGLEIAAQEWGNPAGVEVLFLHGFCQSHLSWRHQVTDATLAATCRMITFDLRGHGATGGPHDRSGYEADRLWADDIAAVAAAAGMRRPYLVAWSYAGRVVSDYLRTRGETDIAGINYVDASCAYGAEHFGPNIRYVGKMRASNDADRAAATRAFLTACFEIQPTADDFDALLSVSMSVPADIRNLILDRPADTMDAMADVTVPVLVTHGRKDSIIAEPMARQIAATVRDARLSFYDDIGHSPFWEDPRRFNAELKAFVQ
jgi:pimeloyl-ACP methyl ester carboxylesterase